MWVYGMRSTRIIETALDCNFFFFFYASSASAQEAHYPENEAHDWSQRLAGFLIDSHLAWQ